MKAIIKQIAGVLVATSEYGEQVSKAPARLVLPSFSPEIIATLLFEPEDIVQVTGNLADGITVTLR